MSTSTTRGKIEFIQYHQPALKAGDYEIAVDEQISSTNDKVPTGTNFNANQTFSVLGERFSINPQEIHAVFPPAGSLGEHSNVLPHLILKRSTLPWERMVKPCEGCPEEKLPWLALLLFDEDETLTPQIITVSDLKSGSAAKFPEVIAQKSTPLPAEPYLELEMEQRDDDKLTVIDVSKSLLQNILPSKNDLFLLAHVRLGSQFGVNTTSDLENELNKGTLPDSLRDGLKEQGYPLPTNAKVIKLQDQPPQWKIEEKGGLYIRKEQDENKEYVLNVYSIEDEKAVLIANRLPKAGKTSTVHLVSLENRYNGSGFDFQGAADADMIRLVSLKNWRFACVDEKQSFKELLIHLNREPDTFTLPQKSNPDVNKYLLAGNIPLWHSLREGDQTVSWYHGPLHPGENQEQITLPIRAADELVRYDPSCGLFDVSYAAAWELGRLLTLQSKRISLALYNWKRAHAQQLKQVEQNVIHLSAWTKNQPDPSFPEVLDTWFNDLSLLKGIPFNYLVPDEQLLPKESIRFFWVDRPWVECLVDGAYSIGRVNKSDHQKQHSHKPALNDTSSQVTGFLLRSDVVSGWPDLQVDGYDEIVDGDDFEPSEDKLTILRMDRLSPKVLICLFEGEVKTVDIHQKPEALHFGLNRPDDQHPTYYKFWRNCEGQEVLKQPIIVQWKDEEKRILDINKLGKEFGTKLKLAGITSAQFGLEMIEGVQKVRFAESQ